MGGASFSLQHRLQPMSQERRLKPALQTKVCATLRHTHDPKEADSEEFAKVLGDASAVWFNGGQVEGRHSRQHPSAPALGKRGRSRSTGPGTRRRLPLLKSELIFSEFQESGPVWARGVSAAMLAEGDIAIDYWGFDGR